MQKEFILFPWEYVHGGALSRLGRVISASAIDYGCDKRVSEGGLEGKLCDAVPLSIRVGCEEERRLVTQLSFCLASSSIPLALGFSRESSVVDDDLLGPWTTTEPAGSCRLASLPILSLSLWLRTLQNEWYVASRFLE